MIDISKKLTVFVISSGEETFVDCLNSLSNQDCVFQIKHIKNVFPMSKAFQSMPDNCETKYFIQLDSDMLLFPQSVRVLYEAISSSSFATYMITGSLKEKDFGIRGHVKCWKKSIFKWISFRDCRSVDRDLYKRLRYFGLRKRSLPDVLGEHIPRHSMFSSYLKSKADIEKWKFLQRPPIREVGSYFWGLIPKRKYSIYAIDKLDEYWKTYPISKHELLGTLLGVLTPEHRFHRSKDINYERILFDKILDIFGQAENFPHALTRLNGNGEIRKKFIKCYSVSKSSRTVLRKELAMDIMKIYCPEIAEENLAGDLLSLLN